MTILLTPELSICVRSARFNRNFRTPLATNSCRCVFSNSFSPSPMVHLPRRSKMATSPDSRIVEYHPEKSAPVESTFSDFAVYQELGRTPAGIRKFCRLSLPRCPIDCPAMSMEEQRKRPLWTCPQCRQKFVTKHVWHSCSSFTLEEFFGNKCSTHKKLYGAYLKLVRACGPVKANVNKSRISFQARVRFAGISRVTKDGLVGLLA